MAYLNRRHLLAGLGTGLGASVALPWVIALLKDVVLPAFA